VIRSSMRCSLLGSFVVLATLAACKSEAKKPAATASATTPAPGAPAAAGAGTAATPTAATAPDAAPPPRPPAQAREGGPTQEQCEKFADHSGGFLVESMAPPNANAEQLKYVQTIVKKDRPNQVRFCLEALEVAEVECVLKAGDFPALAACERLRRQIPKDLLKNNEVSPEDCERFYVRYKQFMMTEGMAPEQVEKAKDQLIRTCEEKAKPGTIACFLTAATYEEARRCP
jgi:hypothetical protein